MKKPSNKKDSLTDALLERLMHDALRLAGELPPTTEQEVARLEEEIGVEPNIELPESLRDALALRNHRSRFFAGSVLPLPLHVSLPSQENLARAARDGAEIPPEVEAQMRQDREVSERERKEEP